MADMEQLRADRCVWEAWDAWDAVSGKTREAVFAHQVWEDAEAAQKRAWAAVWDAYTWGFHPRSCRVVFTGKE